MGKNKEIENAVIDVDNVTEVNEEVKAPKISLKKIAVGLGIVGAIGFGIARVVLAGKGEEDLEDDELDDDETAIETTADETE